MVGEAALAGGAQDGDFGDAFGLFTEGHARDVMPAFGCEVPAKELEAWQLTRIEEDVGQLVDFGLRLRRLQ